MDVKDLSPAQCVLLAVHLASESNVKALHSFTPARSDALGPELVLRILLTCLPETVDPREYISYVQEVASRLYLDVDREDVEVNTAPVRDLSVEVADQRVKKLRLLKIMPPNFPPYAPDDLLTRFICYRAYRIDSETGMLNLLPVLVEPFVGRNDFIRTWYISVVLPVTRHALEYYPETSPTPLSIGTFESVTGREGIELLMSKSLETTADATTGNVARDVKSLVGPWMYGHTERKRRKMNIKTGDNDQEWESLSLGVRKIAIDGISAEDKTGHDWEHMYQWLVGHAVNKLDVIAQGIEDWDGPGDVDLGGFERGSVQYLDEEVQIKLELQYAQAAFAACYVAELDSEETVRNAHAILARLAVLLDFVPPPDLATSVESLPFFGDHIEKLDSEVIIQFTPDSLLQPDHPLTSPRLQIYMLLQMIVYSAYQFCSLGQPSSPGRVAKLHFKGTEEEQLDVLRRILRDLAKAGAGKDDSRLTADRAKLLWLRSWGIDAKTPESEQAFGVFGKISQEVFESEMLKVFVESTDIRVAPAHSTLPLGHPDEEVHVEELMANDQKESDFPFVVTDADKARLDIEGIADHTPLALSQTEKIIFNEAMKAYDGASNGNKHRGGVKKANDIIAYFRPKFTEGVLFRQGNALIAATHALSFYSLTLQHGVPFQPVSIRVSHDPLSLISKVLEQNPRSYSKLDDLIDIAQNLESSSLSLDENDPSGQDQANQLSEKKKEAAHRVTFMCVEAALREDDFETAYSYTINRLSPSSRDVESHVARASMTEDPKFRGHAARASQTRNVVVDDDISWRAAFLAGRYRPNNSAPPSLRRLEQRTELLSLALLLAPSSALTEILTAWRRCEEEMTALLMSQQAADDEFDDHADKRMSGTIPGNFTVPTEQPDLIYNQKRREVGRLGADRGEDETPLSMFDLTRNAARALSSNAFPLRGAARASTEGKTNPPDPSAPSSPTQDSQRVRKRDMVANAVGGSLASGLGWVLGATPVNSQPQPHSTD